MLIYILLLVPVLLPSIHASKRENVYFSDKINTDENYVHDKDERIFEKKDIESRDVGSVNILKRQVIIDGSKIELGHIQRHKRQWAGILAVVSGGISLVGLGLNLGQTLSGGCMYYPSICKNKKRMEDIERRLVPLQAKYDKLYLHNKKEFLNLMTANSKNAYILYYINETIRNIYSLQDYETFLSAELELNIPKISDKYTNAQNVTSKEYLESIVGSLEYRVSDIKTLIKDKKTTMFIGLVFQFVLGAVLNAFTYGMSRVNQQIAWTKYLVQIGNVAPLPSYNFYQMRNTVLRNSRVHTQAALQDMSVKRKAETPANMQASKRPTKTQIGFAVLGFIGEVVAQVVSAWQWKETADKIEKKRIQYEKDFDKFLKELNDIRNEKVELAKRWSEVISSFNSSTSIFKTLLEGSRNFSQFNADVGNPQLPMNTSNPIFDINYKTLKRDNILSAQERVLSFLRVIDNNVTMLVDRMYGRSLLYKKVLIMTDSNHTIDNIFDSITEILKSSQSKAIKEYGTSLTKKDLVCTISLLRRDLQNYDFFPLVIFRPKCNLSIADYKLNEQIANKNRKENILDDIISKTLNTNKSLPTLADLTESIKNVYFASRNPEMSRYGQTITEKDVLCSIATQFPSKQVYDFISLIPFQTGCGTVDEKTFQKMKTEANTVRKLSQQINSVLDTCKLIKIFCPCPSLIANTFEISIENVINLIKLHGGPQMQKYCGTTGCSCVDLK